MIGTTALLGGVVLLALLWNGDGDEEPAIGSLESPVPAGRSVDVFDGAWTIAVVDATADATADVLAADPANRPPKPGHQFSIVRIEATYQGRGEAVFLDFELKATGDSDRVYSTVEGGGATCGVIPNGIASQPEVSSGRTTTGNSCFEIESSDADSLVLFWQGEGGESVYLAVP